jgi:ATP diphosphatase
MMSQGIDSSLLQKALEIQLKCAEFGFDWPDVAPVFDKIVEEIDEVKAEVNAPEPQQHKIEDEVGDLLFAAVNLSRHLHINPDLALEKATEKFCKRFALVQTFAATESLELKNLSAEELEILWQKAKLSLIQADKVSEEAG